MEPRPRAGPGHPQNQPHGGETAGTQRMALWTSQGSSRAALDKDVKSPSGVLPVYFEDFPLTLIWGPRAATSGY